MSNIALNLNLGSTGGAQQSQAADEDSGKSVTEQIARIMKKIAKLQKQASALQGPPDQVAKMRKVIEQEIKVLEMKMKQLMEQEAKKNQMLENSAREEKPGDVAGRSLRKLGTGTIVNEKV